MQHNSVQALHNIMRISLFIYVLVSLPLGVIVGGGHVVFACFKAIRTKAECGTRDLHPYFMYASCEGSYAQTRPFLHCSH